VQKDSNQEILILVQRSQEATPNKELQRFIFSILPAIIYKKAD
jgi:hypothetical protein